MRVTHASQTQDGKRLTYHGPSHGLWSTPSAPTFDRVGMPKRNTYRPNAGPLHSADLAVAERQKAERKAVRKADRVFNRSQAKVNPRPVVLRKPDGSTVPTFKHPAAITARIVQPKHQIGKSVDLATFTADAVHAKPGTLYTLERPDVAPVAPVLVAETVAPVARTRDVSAFLAILSRLAPSKDHRPGLDTLDGLRETKRELGTAIE